LFNLSEERGRREVRKVFTLEEPHKEVDALIERKYERAS
jgi:hypothetical protein